QPEPAPAPKPFMNQAREHLRGGADPAESVRLAKPLRNADASQKDSDGAFLLLEDAAQKGNPEAMHLYAQFYDPNCKLPRGTIQPDIEQAHDWYRKAASAGSAEAKAALEELKKTAEAKAKAGDRNCRRLLRRW
ncbi:MAG: sel1 repeat family protein, partial [Desulfovibrio sp.]|nr:sel1 repeat family protein [Desulfovibrio sp.]